MSQKSQESQGQPFDHPEAASDDRDGGRFLDRRDRLLRWGWTVHEAEMMARRLSRCGAEDDPRVTCAGDCAHYRPGRCSNHRAALLSSPDVGRELATLLQRCPGFRPAVCEVNSSPPRLSEDQSST